MKELLKGRRLVTVLIVLALVLSVLCAHADSVSSCPAAESETVAALLDVLDFKFFVRPDGIGKGTAPVYTAPSEDSLRLAGGSASCDVEAEIAPAGYVNGEWLMVRYDLKDGKARVGYIPPKYSRSYVAEVYRIEFDEVPVQLAAPIEITDNPRGNSTPFGTLPKGTDITVLAKYTYTGNWWYVETTLDGQLTRGFIDRSAAALLADGETYFGIEDLGFPAASPEGRERIGTVTIHGTEDDARIVRRHADKDSPMVARVYGEDSFPCYGAEEGANGKIWYQIWVDGVWGWYSSAGSTLTEGE